MYEALMQWQQLQGVRVSDGVVYEVLMQWQQLQGCLSVSAVSAVAQVFKINVFKTWTLLQH